MMPLQTKHARGQLGSYEPGVLVARAAAAVADPLVCMVGAMGERGKHAARPALMETSGGHGADAAFA